MAQSSPYDFDIYQPRNPKASAYYKCVENHFEECVDLIVEMVNVSKENKK